MPVPRSAAGVRITFAPSMRMILRRSTEKVSVMTATKRVALGGAHHGERDAGVTGGRFHHRLAGLQRPAALAILDDGDGEAVLDGAQGIEELALHVQRDVLRGEALQPHHRSLADRAENAVVDHDALSSPRARRRQGASPGSLRLCRYGRMIRLQKLLAEAGLELAPHRRGLDPRGADHRGRAHRRTGRSRQRHRRRPARRPEARSWKYPAGAPG